MNFLTNENSTEKAFLRVIADIVKVKISAFLAFIGWLHHITFGFCRKKLKSRAIPRMFICEEAVMAVLAFANPLYVKDKNQIVHEITCVENALEFLYEWPKGRRGTIYATAVKACQAALIGELAAVEAGKSFKGFAKSARILTDLSALVPMLNGPAKSQGTIPT